jgi:hypothetical protein
VKVLTIMAAGLLMGVAAAPAVAAPTVAVQPVAVQPEESGGGPSVRDQVARIVRAKGFRVNLAMPAATGTTQYVIWAREHAVTAFVVTELQTWGKGKYGKATFLVWNGVDGAVIGRWSVSSPMKKMWKAIAKDFWKRLGPALEFAQPPDSEVPVGEAPPMEIDASSSYDDSVVSSGGFRRRRSN